ncbi:hypothetical protein Tco_1138012 [Tanacetum coccineum]
MTQASPKTLIVKSHLPITNCVIGLANAKTWYAILSKIFGVKIPPTITCAKEKKGKRKIEGEAKPLNVFCSDSSNYSKGVPEKRPSIQGLLDWWQESIYRLALRLAFATCNLQASICSLPITYLPIYLHLQLTHLLAFATITYLLALTYPFACTCNN